MNINYTYKLTHKTTDQFYIGSRQWTGKPYYSSSKSVKELGFENFNIEIIKHDYWHPSICYWHEQQMIKENIANPLCLNKWYQDPETDQKKFSNRGGKLSLETRLKMSKPKSEETRKKMSLAMKGRKRTPEHQAAINSSLKGRPSVWTGKKMSAEARQKISKARAGRKIGPMSEETKVKISLARLGIERGPYKKRLK